MLVFRALCRTVKLFHSGLTLVLHILESGSAFMLQSAIIWVAAVDLWLASVLWSCTSRTACCIRVDERALEPVHHLKLQRNPPTSSACYRSPPGVQHCEMESCCHGNSLHERSAPPSYLSGLYWHWQVTERNPLLHLWVDASPTLFTKKATMQRLSLSEHTYHRCFKPVQVSPVPLWIETDVFVWVGDTEHQVQLDCRSGSVVLNTALSSVLSTWSRAAGDRHGAGEVTATQYCRLCYVCERTGFHF